MTICGCDYNLVFKGKTLDVKKEIRRITFFEEEEDFQQFVEFPYRKFVAKGKINTFNYFPIAEGIEIPEWAQYFTLE